MKDEFYFFHPRGPGLGPIRSTLNEREIKKIIAAIEIAWESVESFPYLKSGQFVQENYKDEDNLSTKLVEILNYMLSNSDVKCAFRKTRFQAVIRDGKQSSATNKSLDQMPDITFRMIKSVQGEDVDESALFVEAKLVDEEGSCRQYVVNGLYRFVSGKYAPRMTFGLMLGYATENSLDPSHHLEKYFEGATSSEALQCKASLTSTSIHSKCFASDHTRGSPCAPKFRALHFWVARNFAEDDETV